MALAKNLEALLQHMEAAAAATQRKFWEENPAIAKAVDEGTVPQAEFNRQLNEKDQKVKAAEETSSKWKAWADKNEPKHTKLVEDYEKLEKAHEALKVLKTRVAEGAEGTDIDTDDLAERVLAKVSGKTVTSDQLNQLIATEKQGMLTEMRTLVDKARTEFLTQTFPQTTQFVSDLTDVMMDHREEFAEKLDREKFAAYMKENKIVDPKEAHSRFVAERRTQKKIDEEVDKKVKTELAKHNLPGVSSTSGHSDVGPLELKIAGKTPKFNEGTELGDLSASAMAAQELRQEGRA